MAIKNGDFIQLDYVGKTKDDNVVFDTTIRDVAQKNNIFNPRSAYGSITIVLGEKHLISGLDEKLVGKEVGKDYSVDIPSDKAFGKRDAKLLQLIPVNKFRKEKLNPMPGLQVSVDGHLGIVRSVSGGRTIVDFNHPLASRDLVYDVTLKKVVMETKDKIKAFLSIKLSQKEDSILISFSEGKARAGFSFKLPDEICKKLESDAKRLIPEIKALEFFEKPKEEKTDKQSAVKSEKKEGELVKNA